MMFGLKARITVTTAFKMADATITTLSFVLGTATLEANTAGGKRSIAAGK